MSGTPKPILRVTTAGSGKASEASTSGTETSNRRIIITKRPSNASTPQSAMESKPESTVSNTTTTTTTISTKASPKKRTTLPSKAPASPPQQLPSTLSSLVPPPSATTKAGRQLKPTAKKRDYDELGDEEIIDLSSSPQSKKKKLTLKGRSSISLSSNAGSGNAISSVARQSSVDAPRIHIKQRGKPPPRIHGDGYDSEASDRELDPVVEEELVLRMLPGEHCDRLQKAVDENRVFAPHDGGFDIHLRFFDDERRAVVVVEGQPFAAVLVDLPTITEGMKSWDRKAIMKVADISQMLLVYRQVQTENEAKTVPLPSVIEMPGYKWPHGITPPMHDCVKRRFAKTISRKEIEDKEALVEQLLAADRTAVATRYEFVSDDYKRGLVGKISSAAVASSAAHHNEDEDAEGELDADEDETYMDDGMGSGGGGGVGDSIQDNLELDLEAELEAAMAQAAQEEHLEAMSQNISSGMSTTSKGGAAAAAAAGPTAGSSAEAGTASTPSRAQDEVFEDADGEESEEEDDDEDEDDDEEDDDDEMDEEAQAHMDEVRAVREDIAELRAQLRSKEADLQKPNVANSAILRKRVQETIRVLKSEIQLKLSSINEVEEEEDAS